MVRPASAACVVLLALVLVAITSLPTAAQDFTLVDEAAHDAISSSDIPGVVVLVGRGDETLFLRAYGWRTLVPEPQPMGPDTIFDIASLTKPFGTTLAMMSLIEQGAVKLDAPLGRYLKEFRGRTFANITIERVLTHTAGFAAIPPTGAVTHGFPAAA